MTIGETRAKQAELTVERLTAARQEAMTALAALEPNVGDVVLALGKAGLAARLGQGKASEVARLGSQVADLERQRAEHQAVAAEAERQIRAAEVELARLVLHEKRYTYTEALTVRDATLTLVLAAVETLRPQIDQLWREEAAAYGAAIEAEISGHPNSFKSRISEVLTQALGVGYVPANRHWDIRSMIDRQRTHAQQAVEEVAAA